MSSIHHGNNENDNVHALRVERDRLRLELDTTRHDLRQARLELTREREIQESLAEQLHAGDGPVGHDRAPRTGVAGSARAQVRLRAWPARLWRRMTLPAGERATLQNIGLVRVSKWFDAEWYASEYPDVINAGLDPAEHYVRHGALEGRDPGPLFSTEAYLREHPDVGATGANALLHFLRSGRDAGT